MTNDKGGKIELKDNIKSIIFTFDNLEEIEIDWKYIGRLFIDDITETIIKVQSDFIRAKKCKHFAVAIHRNANEKYNPFNIEVEEDYKFNRLLKFYDIVYVTIIFDNGLSEEIYVPYLNHNIIENKYQTAQINKFGDLFIVIDQKKTVDDIFPKEKINDEDWIKHFFMN